MFTVGHVMICQCGRLVIERHNEIRNLQAELLDMVSYDMQVEPALQPITGEELARETNRALMHALTSIWHRELHFSI